MAVLRDDSLPHQIRIEHSDGKPIVSCTCQVLLGFKHGYKPFDIPHDDGSLAVAYDAYNDPKNHNPVSKEPFDVETHGLRRRPPR